MWGFLYNVIHAVLTALPSYSSWLSGLGTNITDGAHDIGLKIGTFRYVVDLSFLATLMGIVVTTATVAASVWIVRWLYERLPGKAA